MQDKTQEQISICTATVTQEGPAKWNVAFDWKDGAFCVPGEYKLYAAPVQAAPAAVAVPAKVVEALEMLENGALNVAANAKNRGDGYDEGYANAMAKMARETLDALAATPAAAHGKLDDDMQMRCRKCGEQVTIEFNSARIVTHNPHTGKPRDARDMASDPEGKLIVAPGPLFAAAEPVVLPPPDLWRDDEGLRGYAADPGRGPWYTAETVRALLAQAATGLPAPAVRLLPWRSIADGLPAWTDDSSIRVIALTSDDDFGGVQLHDITASDFHAVDPENPEEIGTEVTQACTHWAYRDDVWPRAGDAPASQLPVLYVSKEQLDHHRDPDGPDSANAGRYLPARETPAGKLTTPLFAAPQAQADAPDADDAALIEWLSGRYISTDYHWGDPKTTVLVIEIPPTTAVCGDFRTDVREAMAIAAAKGD